MRRPYLLASTVAFLLAPLSALAFETVDTMPWASGGRFPAYPPEEIRPYEVFVEGGLMYDSNILRRNAGAENEVVQRYGAGGRVDQRIWGRQTLHLDARGDVFLFDKFGDLDHFAYSGAATWLWELSNDFSGAIGYGRTHRLAALTEVQRAIKRMVTTDDFFANGAWRLGPNFRTRGGISYGRGVRDTPGEDKVTFGTRTATVGADYVTPLGNALGIEYRRTRGDAPISTSLDPNGVFINNDYEERETALVATYTSSATVRFTGRVGHTERTYTQLPNNFSGTTYRGGLEWLPGNKTILAFEAYREPRAIIDIAASHVLVKGFAFGPAWAATAKLAFSLRMVSEHRQFVAADPNVAPVGTLLEEDVRIARFGIAWEPERLMQVGLGIDRGTRQSNILGRDYNFTAFMANIRVTW
jgi:hypothetical protein